MPVAPPVANALMHKTGKIGQMADRQAPTEDITR
jgi:hypothetical protein